MIKIKHKVTKKERRRLTLFIMAFIFIIGFTCINIFPDWLKIMKNKKEITLLESSYEELLDTEEALKAEVEKLQDPEYVERYAKEKFLYTKDDEMIIRKTDTQ
ncbi:MAG TPA: septum formation initiator family protein [Candidatus Caccenecus avistercoris]|nr:septum formation initiator family protein [Candidatus Caccenecus avistercoris]